MDLPSFEELCSVADEQLFHKASNNDHHLLSDLLPPQTIASQKYNLRKRIHNRHIPEHTGNLTI